MKPTVLYKYATPNTAEIILENGRLRWSNPSVFNDLNELQRIPCFEPTVCESYQNLLKTLLDAACGRLALDANRLTPRTRKILDQVIQGLQVGKSESELLGVLCDFKPSDADQIIDKGLREYFALLAKKGPRILCLTSTYNNEVMWGTYAENHHGVVLGFTAALPDSPFHEVKQVTYSDRPIAGSGLDFLLYGDTPELRRRTIEAVCYSKKLAWSYEQEWRLITWRSQESHSDHGDYIFYPAELESVTFGVRAKPEVVKTMCKTIHKKYPSTTIFQMLHQQGSLNRVPLET